MGARKICILSIIWVNICQVPRTVPDIYSEHWVNHLSYFIWVWSQGIDFSLQKRTCGLRCKFSYPTPLENIHNEWIKQLNIITVFLCTRMTHHLCHSHHHHLHHTINFITFVDNFHLITCLLCVSFILRNSSVQQRRDPSQSLHSRERSRRTEMLISHFSVSCVYIWLFHPVESLTQCRENKSHLNSSPCPVINQAICLTYLNLRILICEMEEKIREWHGECQGQTTLGWHRVNRYWQSLVLFLSPPLMWHKLKQRVSIHQE